MDAKALQQLIEQALAALAGGDPVRALAVADQLVAAAPQNATVRRVRAEALLALDTADQAVDEAKQAVELDPDSVAGQRVLGLAAWQCQRLTLAQESLGRAVELSGRRPELLAEYAWFMASQRGPRLAEEAARKAVEADEKSCTAWAALGLAQFRLRRRDEAEQSLRQALKLDPRDLHARSTMVLLLQDQRKDDQAETLAECFEGQGEGRDLVAAVRQEAKKRQIARMLVERAALPEPATGSSGRRHIMWIAISGVLATAFCLLLQPDDPQALTLCVVLPLFMLWLMRRILI